MDIKDFVRGRLVTVHREILALDDRGQELDGENIKLVEKIKNPTSEAEFLNNLKEARLFHAEFTIARKNFETQIGILVEIATMFKLLNLEDETESEKEALEFEQKVKDMVKPFYVIENGVITGKDLTIHKAMVEYLEKDFSKNLDQDKEFYKQIKKSK